MKTSKWFKRIISLFCAILMIVSILPMHQAAVARADTLKYESCLYAPEPGQKHSIANNNEDVCTTTIALGGNTKKILNGWVLSTTQISYYRIYFVRGSESAPRRQEGIAAASWNFGTDTNLLPGFYEHITRSNYITKNSKWEYVLDSSWMSPGSWTIYVRGYLTGAENVEIKVARIKVNVTATSNYASNLDEPYHTSPVNNNALAVSVSRFDPKSNLFVSGWAMHDRGIQSYAYRIRRVGNGNSIKTGALSASNRGDLNDVSKAFGVAINDHYTRTGFSGYLPLKDLSVGNYEASITATALDGESFVIANISIRIVCKNGGHKWIQAIDENNKAKRYNNYDEEKGRFVRVCEKCGVYDYEYFITPTNGMHYLSDSGSNEWTDMNAKTFSEGEKKRDTAYGGEPGDQTGNEWNMRDWSKDPTNWVMVLRPVDQKVALRLVELSIDAALNDNIGYTKGKSRPVVEDGNITDKDYAKKHQDYLDYCAWTEKNLVVGRDENAADKKAVARDSYLKALRGCNYAPEKVGAKCDQDCSAGVSANVLAVGYQLDNMLKVFTPTTTTYLDDNLLATGAFAVVYDTRSGDVIDKELLLPGDILLREGKHTAVNISVGSIVKDRWNPETHGEGNSDKLEISKRNRKTGELEQWSYKKWNASKKKWEK